MRKRKDLTYINNYEMGQILGVSPSSFIRDPIYKDLTSVNNFKPTTIISEVKNLRSNYNKNLVEFFKCKDHYCGYNTHKDFWDYRLELFEQGLIEIKEKKKKKTKVRPWGFSDPSIYNFLNSIPESLANKAYDVLNETPLDEVYYYAASLTDIEEIKNYEEEIFTEGHFLNRLYNVKDEGIGKGEALMAFLFKDSSINGYIGTFDLRLKDTNNEIKSSNNGSYRLGTKGSVGQFKFFAMLLETRRILRELFNDPGEDYFNQYTSDAFYKLSKDFLDESETGLSTAIDRAEIYNQRLHLINLWYHYAYTELYKFDHAYEIKQDVLTKTFQSEGNILKALKSIEYVRHPSQFKKDINLEIKKFFDTIDNLIVFDEKNKVVSIVTSSDEMMLDVISQNGLKVIEKRCRNKNENLIVENTLVVWKLDKLLDFYELYINMAVNVN